MFSFEYYKSSLVQDYALTVRYNIFLCKQILQIKTQVKFANKYNRQVDNNKFER